MKADLIPTVCKKLIYGKDCIDWILTWDFWV